ncbi:MAG: thioredoxin [Thermoplasmatota archaeon]
MEDLKMSKPVKITDKNFDELIQEHENVIVDFWATWCGPCKRMEPVYEELAKEYGNVLFGKVNTENNPQTTSKFGVQAIPAFIFIKNGQPVGQATGAVQKDQMKNKIEDIFDL